MTPQKRASQSSKLVGRAFPFHQLRTSSRFAIAGALTALFVVPVSVAAFQLNDKSSIQARPGFIFLYVILFAWIWGWVVSIVRYRTIVHATYQKEFLIPKGGWKFSWANRLRWVLVWCSAISWAVMILTGSRKSVDPDSIAVSPWAFTSFVLAGMVAIGMTAILTGLKPELGETGALHLEKARGLSEEIRGHEASLKDKTESIASSLGERIAKRILDLERIHGEIDNAERKRQLIQREVNSEMLALNREIYAQGSRRELFRQWGFVIVSFALGFVVNWLSTPALELFRGFHF